MRILLISDMHFGFGSSSERWDDSFLAVESIIEKEWDAILIAGDIFDTRIPNTETFARTMGIFLKTQKIGYGVNVTGVNKNIGKINGVPIIAINGNHERRVKGLVNPVEALETGGFLVRLHCNGVLLEKNGERVFVQGMSAVPEQYAVAAMEEWGPKPKTDCYNIIMIHQNLEGFVRSEKNFPKSSLPEGFDLYVCGDIHESHKTNIHGKTLIIPGSTVATQINKDACNPRVYTEIDTKGQVTQRAFENQRPIYYKEFEDRESIEKFMTEVSENKSELKPIVKSKSPVKMDELKTRFGEDIILMNVAEKHTSVSITEQKFSVQESGKKLLEKNLKELGLEAKVFSDLFELLLNKKQEEALSLLRQNVKINHGKSD